ncbi:S-adenosyl-L-methionine-dependent methyltransferase [Pilobolus umbonatus]|nr:S-adenosyl-L-methionine-dependent methyltransferase [Pilobolus umbonatus]
MLNIRRQIVGVTKTYFSLSSRKGNVIRPVAVKCFHTITPSKDEKKTTPGLFSPFFSPSTDEVIEEHARAKYPRKTAYDTAKSKTPPTCTKMLVRDFIDDSLYNPNYGYFSKQAVIFSPETDFDFPAMRDHLEFMNILGQMYKDIEGDADEPWYGYAVAKYLVTEYKLNIFPHRDLIIYEMGAGNGTLMMNILDYIQQNEPAVYKRTQYNIIEISGKLAERQSERQEVREAKYQHKCVKIINKSIFDWDIHVPDQCFFLGMEVIDNFAHDLIRYDMESLKPYQALLLQSLPVAPNMTSAEFIPTKLFLLFQTLKTYFPQHRLVLSDFSELPDSVDGVDAPVVQTRYRGTMVPCSTYMVQPGWFDIFFPTNFELMRDMYLLICRGSEAGNDTIAKVLTHREFCERYGDIERTRTRSGENPMLMYYENMKMILT